ncbi:hypothetical protein [Undibacterium sp. Tian12W]|uniref:hypothetical protein n=1 Tax=Undibacterium sp. Tian12W TaxID=3413054 RepID=UPI003BF011B1
MSDQRKYPPSRWEPELHEHLLFGECKRWQQGDWSADTIVNGLDYPITIKAMGTEPVKAQIDRFAELIARLPEIIVASNLPDAPTDEWRTKHPDYRLLNAHISSLILYENGSFFVRLDAYPEDDWAPGFDISSDFKVTLAEWAV